MHEPRNGFISFCTPQTSYARVGLHKVFLLNTSYGSSQVSQTCYLGLGSMLFFFATWACVLICMSMVCLWDFRCILHHILHTCPKPIHNSMGGQTNHWQMSDIHSFNSIYCCLISLRPISFSLHESIPESLYGNNRLNWSSIWPNQSLRYVTIIHEPLYVANHSSSMGCINRGWQSVSY